MLSPELHKEAALRKELLRVVLRETLKATGVPPPWIAGETTPVTDDQGRLAIEVRLIVECDEPRFLYYLGAFQAEFEKRLLQVEPRAWDWVSRLSWSLHAGKDGADPDYVMPPQAYWEHVLRDRELKARQDGRLDWDQETLARHFDDTTPNHPDFENTRPPDRDLEDLLPSPDPRD